MRLCACVCHRQAQGHGHGAPMLGVNQRLAEMPSHGARVGGSGVGMCMMLQGCPQPLHSTLLQALVLLTQLQAVIGSHVHLQTSSGW